MRILFFTLASLLLLNSVAQEEHFHCATDEMTKNWFEEHPEQKARFDRLQQDAADLDQELYKTNYGKNTTNNNQLRTTAASIYTIPVVFHILHMGGGENISDAQVQDAVNILTRDYNMLNSDLANVVSQFQSLTGNPQFEFQLATKDPQGKCTNGIIRHWDANTDWQGGPGYIYTWNPTRYLNVYVVRSMGGGAAGYTYLPGTFSAGSSMDAIVILHNYVGSIGTGSDYRSRALTHEVGHWFNLQHVWGSTNNPGVACGNDGVSDTPVTKGHSSCTLNNAITCNAGVVENIQNYMEYAYCSNMFTIGQATRMTNSINSLAAQRNNLSTATNLANTGVTVPGTNCLTQFDMAAVPSATVCLGQALSFSTYTYNTSPTSYLWSATGNASIANNSSQATSITFNSVGNAVVTCTVSSTGGTEVKSLNVVVKNNSADVTFTYHEGFESDNLPDLWSVSNLNTSHVWELTNDATYSGFGSMVVKGETLNANSVVLLESPTYDFKNNPGTMFTFYYAYAKQNAQNKDLFRLQASKDCGATWYNVWTPNMSSTANNSGGTTSELFMPTQEAWLYYDKLTTANNDFNQFKNEDHVKLRFYFKEDVDGSGFGNRFYLDEINFSLPAGINELTKSINLNVYPNPATEESNLSFILSDHSKIKYSLTSVTGAVIIENPETTFNQGPHNIKLNTQKLNSGIYFINLELNGVKMSKKLVVNR